MVTTISDLLLHGVGVRLEIVFGFLPV